MRIRHLALVALASAIVAAGLSALHPREAPRAPAGRAAEAASASAPARPLSPPASASSPGPAEPPPWARVAEQSDEACPASMILVDAPHCPFLAHRCADRGADGICHRYMPQALCEGERRRRRFCIDRFEYPNLEGARVATAISFAEAERACAAEDKRLCRVAEWELACEGPGLWPLPTGVRRDPRVCAIDGPAPSRGGVGPIGRSLACASPFGVMDLTGGVDEWIVDDAGSKVQPPFLWVRAGGSSRRGRACREHDRDAGPGASEETGFRCCSDAAPPRSGEAPRPLPSPPPPSAADAPPRGWISLELPPAREL